MDPKSQSYTRIRSEIVRLNRDWNTFHSLFAHDDQRLSLLNNIAPGFFRITQDVLSESVIMTICRLTDPPISSGKENLSLRRFLDEIRESSNTTLADTLQNQLDEILTITEPIRMARNQILSHLDYGRSLGLNNPDPISIQRGLIDETVNRINTLIKTVVLEIEGADYFPDTVIFRGTADDLVYYLEQGFEAGSKS